MTIRGENKMNTSDTINAAHSVAIRMLESNSFVSPDDTVCSLRARSGRIFTGVSHINRNGPAVMAVHAEVEAIQNMQAAGETVIDEIVLIGTHSRMPMFPFNNCIGYILSLHPENANCVIVMQDRSIRITDVGMFTAPSGGPQEGFAYRGTSAHAGGGYFPNNAPPPVNPIKPVNPIPPVNPLPPVNPIPLTGNADPAEDDDEPTAAAAVHTATESVSVNTENVKGDLLKNRVNSLLNVADDDDEEEQKEKKKRFGLFRK